MLSKILIKNYILIDELELDLAEGLNIITGETGAGKSILINAIDIAFGAKAGKEVIKGDAEKAVIELTLCNKKQDLSELFDENGIDNCGCEIVLSREITKTGSRSRVNGCLVNQEFMRHFRELFIDVHSQHQTYSFLQPKYHIILLDAYAKNTCGTMLENYRKEFGVYKDMQARLEELKNSADKTEEQIDFLKFQVNEIDEAQIKSANEDEELNNELAVLENVEKLKDLTGASYWAISGDDGAIIDALMQIKMNLSKASNMDSSLEEQEGKVIEAIEVLKDLSSNLRINSIQERLFLLDKLKRKYGGSLESVMAQGEKLRQELNGIEFSTQNIEELEREIIEKRSKLELLAGEISEERQNYAKVLSALIVEKLEKLELPKVKFEIHFERGELSANGFDKVEFLISTNISEGLKPLAKVASGGEISRVMLAIKTIFAQSDNIGTVIFDEIDTGISGKTSQAVADEVKALAEFMQIIMITHQAIIASKSDRHFYVKKTQDGKTSVDISILEGEAKLKAVAELAGGEVTDESLKFAQTLMG